MVILLLILVVLATLSRSQASLVYTSVIKTSDCGGFNNTCSPKWCHAVTNTACVDPNAGANPVINLLPFGCRKCTQAPLAKCKASYLTSVIKKSK